MKYLIAVLLLFVSSVASAQVPLNPVAYNVADLPAASSMRGKVVSVKDGSAQGDCTVGGGTARTPCISTGSVWVAWADGGGFGTSVVNSVSGASPITSTGGSNPTIGITEDSTHRFATDAEKSTWNSKQAGDADLTAIAGLAPSNDDLIQRKAGAWTNRTPAQFKVDLALVKGDVGLGSVTNDAQLKIASNLSDLANTGTARTNLGVAIGSNVEAWDADLDAIAALAGIAGLARKTAANTWTLDTSVYLTGNQTITLSGDVSGSGATAITTAIGATKVTSAMLNSNVFANPSASIGLSVVNGSAGTAMRSDAAPPLSQAIVPTWSGSHTFAGPVVFDTSGNQIDPLTNYDQNLGQLSKKYLSLHAAELWVETLVAQNTLATIGGRIIVAPTTLLTADLAAAGTTITVKHNNLINGNRIYMESNGKVEFMAVTSGAGGGAGAYTYTVTRNLDSSGANDWFAGDAIINTGTTGNGFIDLYSVSGVLPGSTVGPTIVGNVRTGTTYNNIEPRWAIGNLTGLFGYTVTSCASLPCYGASFGTPSGAWLKVDPTNGIRIGHDVTTKVQIDASGNATFAGALSAATGTFTGDLTGSSMALTGKLTMSGASSSIAIGTTPPTSASAGTGIWLDRTGLYGLASNVVQAKIDAATGAIISGAGKVILNVDGISIVEDSAASYTILKWTNSGSNVGEVYTTRSGAPPASIMRVIGRALSSDTTGYGSLQLYATNSGSSNAQIFLTKYSLSHATSPSKGYASIIVDGVGIGTTEVTVPNAMLDVRGNATVTGILSLGNPTGFARLGQSFSTTSSADYGGFALTTWSAATADQAPVLDLARSRSSTPGTYTVVQNNDMLGHIIFRGSTGAAWGDFARIQTEVDGATIGAGDTPGRLTFSTTPDGSGSLAARMTIYSTGGVVIGAPTGGDKGTGSINAVAVYDDNVLLTDWVFDPGHKPSGSKKLFDLETTRHYTKNEHRLPWMPTPAEFENARHLGGMTTRLWQGQEQQQLYIFQLDDRIRKLEQQQKGNQ